MVLSAAYAQDSGLDSALPVGVQNTVEHGSNFPPFDSSFFSSHLFWLMLSFAVFYFLMARIVLPRIGSAIEERGARIGADLARAVSLKEEADAAMSLYEQQLQQARSQAQILARKAMDEAKALSDRDQAAAEAILTQRLHQAEQKINILQAQVMDHVDQIAAETVDAILLHLTGRKVDKTSLSKALKTALQK